MNSTLPSVAFRDLQLSLSLVQVLDELGFQAPTPVQAKCIPLLLQGKDLIGQSETGSGKTAAFGLPIIQNLILQPRRVQALILCPTRELCAQVAREIRKLGRRHAGLQVLVISGGAPMGPQLGALEKGVHIVVGTPGRVLDHLKRRTLELGDVRTLVLDEADRMLEMGFSEDMEQILSKMPRKRQTVLFSATFPEGIEALSKAYQNQPERVTIARKNQAVASIRQAAFEVEPEHRMPTLLWVLEQNRPETAIVFCNFRLSVTELARELSRQGISVGTLHGDLEQNERDRIMAQFRNRSLRILVATDVAARGIDVDELDAVINYELPQKPEVYLHRIGRTGRAGKSGVAISFHSKRESSKLSMIEKYASTTLQRKSAPSFAGVNMERTRQAIQGEAAMKTLYISGGRKEKLRPGDILGALTGEAGGLSAANIGKIEIHDHFSYVGVSTPLAATALERLRAGRIKGRKFRIEAVR